MKSKEFQYICISFNQEHCITDLLESIKFQVVNYGKEYKNNFFLHDDCSSDDTVRVTKEWISQNLEVFDEVVFQVNRVNIGIKLNYLRAIDSIKSDFFKIIGGDDLFSKNSIYHFIEFSAGKQLVFSPIIIKIGNKFLYDFSFLKLLFLYRNKFIIRELTKRVNLFSAPGSFINRQIITSSEYKNFLLSSSDMVHEDYLSWMYLIINLNKSFSVYLSEAIIYRPKYSKEDQVLDSICINLNYKTSIKNTLYIISMIIIKTFFRDYRKNSLNSQIEYYYNIIHRNSE